MDKLRALKRWWSETGKWLTLLFALIIALSVGCVVDQENFARKTQQEYPVGSMLPVEIGEHTGLFEVEKSFGYRSFFILGEINLYGTLHLVPPEGAKYLGASEGSLVVSWQYPDGTGETWFLAEPRMAGSRRPYPDFNVRAIETRN